MGICFIGYTLSGIICKSPILCLEKGFFLLADKYIKEIGNSYTLNAVEIEYDRAIYSNSYKFTFSRPEWTVKVIAKYIPAIRHLEWTDSEGYKKVPKSIKQFCMSYMKLAIEDFKHFEEKDFVRKYSVEYV